MEKAAGRTQFLAYFARVSENQELRQAVWFYAAHISSYILPLLTFTYLARVMGPADWGRLSVFHSLGLYGSQIVEYGFGFTAARDVARERDDPEGRASTLAEVHAAKILLSCVVIGGAALLYPFLPPIMRSPLLYPLAVAYALAQGSSMVWYFQGTGRLGELAKVDAVSRSVAAIVTVLAVRSPEDGWWMIALNAVACFATTGVGLLMIGRDTTIGIAGVRSAVETLRTAFPLFVFRGAASLYGAANGFILGFFAVPASVGYYSGAERAYKGFTALLHPLMQLMYARVNHSVGRKQGFDDVSWQTARMSGAMMVAAGGLLGLTCLVTAPLAVSILLGPGYEPAVRVLRVFGLVLVVESISIALGIQWMLPLGMDKPFTVISVAAGLTNVVLAYWLAPTHGETGMVLAVLASHFTAAAGCFVYLRLRGLDPFRQTGERR
ncbi:MAG: oligosaccharide flippase family protein [Bryobacteraceae bacterium]